MTASPRHQAVRTRRRAMYLRSLWQDPYEPHPAWIEWSVAGAIVVAFVVGLTGGMG